MVPGPIEHRESLLLPGARSEEHGAQTHRAQFERRVVPRVPAALRGRCVPAGASMRRPESTRARGSAPRPPRSARAPAAPERALFGEAPHERSDRAAVSFIQGAEQRRSKREWERWHWQQRPLIHCTQTKHPQCYSTRPPKRSFSRQNRVVSYPSPLIWRCLLAALTTAGGSRSQTSLAVRSSRSSPPLCP